MRFGAALVGVLVLAAGCASPKSESEAPAVAGAPVATAPGPIASPIPPVKDACGAADVQNLVGRPRSEIPVPLEPNRQRVACTTCPVTQDFRPDRLNFFFDADSGLIREIRCG